MVYSLDEKHKWAFTAVMFAVAFLIVPQMMTIASTIGCEFLSYLTIVGILGVGADPLVKGEKNIVHYTSAAIMGVSSQILVYLVEPYLLMLWIPYILYTLFMDDGRKNMFMGEMVMLSSMTMVCLLHV